jgi:hypothetical protein
MDTLQELVKVVSRKRLSKIDVFDKTFLSQNTNNLYYQLYEGIESGKIKDDSSAALYLYGTEEKDARYRKIKSRFKNKVLKSILLFDSEDVFNNEQGRAYYECVTFNQTIEIIIKLTGTTKLVFELVKENYAKALKFKFYDILRNYSYYLLTFYGLKGDKKSFQEEEPKYLRYIQLSQKEQFAKYLYYKVIADFVGATPITNELLISVKGNVEEFYQLRVELDNPEIDFYYFYLALLYYENNNEMDKILEICSEAEKLMTNKPQAVTNTRQTAILLYKMKALLNSKQYDKGIELLQDSHTIKIPESNYNWFVIKESEFKLHLLNHKITEAYSVYNQVISNSYYKRHVEELTEKWKIFHAYLVFLDNYINKGEFKFSLTKFLNDVPVNSKDKSGFNFAIRVIEMLYQFARKEYNLVFQKMDALRVYRSRYLTDNTYKRNHLFLSLLLKAEKSGFSGKEMENAEWIEIKELTLKNNNIIADWEIVPYEELWNIFVELAKKDKH